MLGPEKGDREFRVWRGGFSQTVWAGWMRFDGTRWVSYGQRHDVTHDVETIAAERTTP